MPPPSIRGIVETAIGVADLARAEAFYTGVLGLERMGGDGRRFCALNAGPGHVLLLFLQGASEEPMELPGGSGTIPGHGSTGRHHFAFAVASDAELDAWTSHLETNGIEVESTVRWGETGSRSLYFRDPDGNLGEFATPGLWPNY